MQTAHSTDYAAITVSDNENGNVNIRTSASDNLPEDGGIYQFAGMFLAALKQGEIGERITYDHAIEGEAMIVFEIDGDSVTTEVICDPPVTLSSGKVSPAQALVFSALTVVENMFSPGALELDHVEAEQS